MTHNISFRTVSALALAALLFVASVSVVQVREVHADTQIGGRVRSGGADPVIAPAITPVASTTAPFVCTYDPATSIPVPTGGHGSTVRPGGVVQSGNVVPNTQTLNVLNTLINHLHN